MLLPSGEIARVVTTRTSSNWIEDGILFSSNNGAFEIDLEEARKITQAFRQLSDQPLPLVVDLGSPKGQTKQARDYFATNPDHISTYSAVALLVSNPIARILANFYLGLNKPDRPTRLFTSVDAAKEWARSFR